MPRLFVSVDLPERLADAVAAVQAPLRDVPSLRFTDPARSHCTLKFLGDVDESRVGDLTDALETAVDAADVSPFEAEVGGLGVFPSTDYISVVWVGVRDGHGATELTRLAEALERETVALGFDEAEAAREEAASAQVRAEKVAAEMRTAVDEYERVFSTAAGGDLTVRLDADADEQALTDLEGAANEMLDDLETIVTAVDADARSVDDDSEALASDVATAITAVDEASSAVDEIAIAATDQRDRLASVTGDLSDLSATVEEVASQADEVASEVDDAAKLGPAGREAATEAADEMATISEQVTAANKAVANLEDRMDAITEMVELIEEVAAETNLLALNTNIEAARAEAATAQGASAVEDAGDRASSLRESGQVLAERVDAFEADRASDGERDVPGSASGRGVSRSAVAATDGGDDGRSQSDGADNDAGVRVDESA
jgi:2'-5' RNA ligase